MDVPLAKGDDLGAMEAPCGAVEYTDGTGQEGCGHKLMLHTFEGCESAADGETCKCQRTVGDLLWQHGYDKGYRKGYGDGRRAGLVEAQEDFTGVK